MDTVQDLSTTIADIKARFKRLEDSYHDLDFDTRRDIRRPHTADRFTCAAIFQHQPSTRSPADFLLDHVLNLKPEAKHDEPTAEVCPFNDYFYCDIQHAQMAVDEGDCTKAAGAITAAEGKLHNVRDMLARTTEAPEQILRKQEGWLITYGWNELCYWVQKGVPLQDAIDRAQRNDDYRARQFNTDFWNGPRLYFSYQQADHVPVNKPVFPTDLPGVCGVPIPKYKPTPDEYQILWNKYKNAWVGLSSFDDNFPHPLDFMEDVFNEEQYISGQPFDVTIKIFFLRAAGDFETVFVKPVMGWETQKLAGYEVRAIDKSEFAILEDDEEIAKLQKYLAKVEMPRWHPDRINRRTGIAGEVDARIGTKEENKAVFLALQDLVEMLKDWKEYFKHPMEINTKWETEKKNMRFWLRREAAIKALNEEWERRQMEEKEKMKAEEEKPKVEEDKKDSEPEEPVSWLDDVC